MQTKISKKEIIFHVNPKIYSQEVVYATCYVFFDRFYIFLDIVGSKIKVTLKLKNGIDISVSRCKGEFMNELLNNALRYKISQRNQKIKEMIVKEALFFSQPKEEIDRFITTKKNKA